MWQDTGQSNFVLAPVKMKRLGVRWPIQRPCRLVSVFKGPVRPIHDRPAAFNPRGNSTASRVPAFLTHENRYAAGYQSRCTASQKLFKTVPLRIHLSEFPAQRKHLRRMGTAPADKVLLEQAPIDHGSEAGISIKFNGGDVIHDDGSQRNLSLPHESIGGFVSSIFVPPVSQSGRELRKGYDSIQPQSVDHDRLLTDSTIPNLTLARGQGELIDHLDSWLLRCPRTFGYQGSCLGHEDSRAGRL